MSSQQWIDEVIKLLKSVDLTSEYAWNAWLFKRDELLKRRPK